MKIGFFLNFEKSLGGGHFWRCFNLAKKLKKRDRKFYFFSNIKDKKILAILKKNNFKYVEIFEKDKKKFLKKLIKKIISLKIINLIIDSYKINYYNEKKIKPIVKKLIVIDDHVDKRHYCDLLINNNFLSKESQKKIKEKNPNINLAIGHNYSIVNTDKIIKSPYFRKPKNITNIFVFFGSSDNTDETSKIIKVTNFFPFIKFNIIIGSFNKKSLEFREIKRIKKNIKFYFNLDNSQIINLIKKNDLAIGAGGVNMIERLYFNLPSFVICVSNNQKNATQYLQNMNSILYLGKSKNVSSQKIGAELKSLIENNKKFEILKKNTLKVSLSLNSKNLITKKLNSVLIK